jgi:hypothetical protein
MKTTEQKEKFVELRAKSWSFKKIAEKLNISKPTLVEWSKELNQEIANMKAIELEALQEKYFLQKKQKIELYGEQLEKIKKELDTRLENNEIKEMKIGELFKLFFDYMDKLEGEKIQVEFFTEREEFNFNDFKDKHKAN